MTEHEPTRVLIRVGRGVVLATNTSQTIYYLIHNKERVEKISLERAASLWVESERKGRKKYSAKQTPSNQLVTKKQRKRKTNGQDADTSDDLKRTKTINVKERTTELESRLAELKQQLGEQDDEQSSSAHQSSKAWREELRRKLGYTEE